VNGRACLTRDPAVLEQLAGEGKPPKVAIGVEVDEAFLHCAKAFKRSALWRPDEWPGTDGLARAAQIWRDHIALDMTTQEVQDFVDDDYANNLSWR
jgi:predicted pyridoxine 5'-phosphate oxidase superfamily flavin-nucleotide-binding protein